MTALQVRIQSIIHQIQWRYNKWCANTSKRDIETFKRLQENIPKWYGMWEEETEQRTKKERANQQKKRRYRKRIDEMRKAYDDLYFVTLTGSDEKIKKNFDKRMLKYAKKYLDENCMDFIANGDRGKKKERFHVHAIVAWNEEHKKWDKGFMTSIKIRNTKEDRNRISSYITKLINHAGKVTSEKTFNKKKGMKEVEKIPF